jgi:hypothetical protein
MRGLFASRGLAAVAASVSALLIVGGGYAIASGGGGSIHACAKKSNGALRLAHRCRKSEHAVTWNARGPAGSPGPRGATGASGATGPQGPPGTQYVWSSFTYPFQARPQTDGHVAKFAFTAPASGFALVTAEFQVRVHNTSGTDCHIESQLATAPAIIGTVQPTQGSAGFVDEWVNGNLPTENGGGTYLGQNMSVSRVFPVTAGSNTVYLNGQYNGYGAGGANCADALWGPITVSAVFANQNPSSSVTAP